MRERGREGGREEAPLVIDKTDPPRNKIIKKKCIY